MSYQMCNVHIFNPLDSEIVAKLEKIHILKCT